MATKSTERKWLQEEDGEGEGDGEEDDGEFGEEGVVIVRRRAFIYSGRIRTEIVYHLQKDRLEFFTRWRKCRK